MSTFSRFRLASSATGTYSGRLFVPPRCPPGPADIAELAGEDDLLASAFQRACEQLLVRSGSIGVRRVEERDAKLDRAMNRGDRLDIIADPVISGHARASETLGRHGQPVLAQSAGLHALPPLCPSDLPAASGLGRMLRRAYRAGQPVYSRMCMPAPQRSIRYSRPIPSWPMSFDWMPFAAFRNGGHEMPDFLSAEADRSRQRREVRR